MKKNILKTFYFAITICLILLITGCGFNINLDPYKNGKKPENDFTLNEILNNNMIIQQNKSFSIKGISEKGVVLTATIYDQEGDVITQAITIAGDEGEFELKLTGIQGSNNRYRLEVSDGLHTHKFRNIMFGEVWMIAGEVTIPDEYVDESDEANLDNIKFIKYYDKKLSWFDYEDAFDISENIKSLATYLNVKLNMPIAIIDGTLDECNADAWLPKKIAANYSTIKKFLLSINRYNASKNTISNKNELGSMYNTYVDAISEFDIAGIIWNQGITDFENYNQENSGTFVTSYSYLLLQIFTEMNNVFNDIDIYCIQDCASTESFASQLRHAQAIPSYQLNNVELITTYDSFEIIEEEIEEELILDEEIEEEQISYQFSIEKYMMRILDTVYQCTYTGNEDYQAPSFNEVLTNDNIIRISFSCNALLNLKDELYGLNIYGNDEKIEFNYQLLNNTIIITLELEEDVKLKDLDLLISYGFVEDLYRCNLKSENGIPVIPFEIKIN